MSFKYYAIMYVWLFIAHNQNPQAKPHKFEVIMGSRYVFYHSTAIQLWKLKDYIYSAACVVWLWVSDMM